jgi:hypothetical protein
MKIKLLLAPALAGFVLVSSLRAGSFAGSVVNYNPGTGITPGYTNASVVLGQPSTSDSYGDPVDPFDPPYATNQIVALGAGGSLTVKFDQPILAGVPGNPFGLDFIIFGNSFFDVTNAFDADYNYIGTPATDGSVIFDACQATVAVSKDGVTFYTLNPALAPQLNDLYPTDAGGNFQIPVNPALHNFAGLTLAQIRALYNGSAGGAGYAIAWAQDAGHQSVSLFEINYIRIDVQSGQALVAGFAAVANPNQVIAEDFTHDPAQDGWKVFGDTNLFAWNSTSQNLQVTWDSSQTNSYFHHPLGTILATNDDFSMSFDLYLTDYAAGPAAQNLYTFELATGFQNYAAATNPGFIRGNGHGAPSLAEFDFFPDDGRGDETVTPAIFDTNGYLSNPLQLSQGDFAAVNLPTGTMMRVSMSYMASNQTTVLNVFTNGVAVCQVIPNTPFRPGFTDFRLDSFAVESYSAYGSYRSSLLAHGSIGNVLLVVPPPPITFVSGGIISGTGQVQFSGLAHWNYVLESSADLQSWSAAGPPVAGINGTMSLQDTNSVQTHQFYRVNAVKAD